MDRRAFNALKIPHLSPSACQRLFGTSDSFKDAWETCQEPRLMLPVAIEALRRSQDANNPFRLGQMLDLMLDITAHSLEPGICREIPTDARKLFDRFLDACYDGTRHNLERTTELSTFKMGIFPDGRAEYEMNSRGCIVPPIVLALIDALETISLRTNCGRFEPADEEDTIANALARLHDATIALDLLARTVQPLGDADLRLERMAAGIRGRFSADALLKQLTAPPPAQPLAWMSFFFHAKAVGPTSSHRPAHATLHDPASDTLLAHLEHGRRVTLIDPDLRITLTEIRPQAEQTIVRVVTDRPVVLKHRQASVQSPTPNEDPVTHTLAALPLWS